MCWISFSYLDAGLLKLPKRVNVSCIMLDQIAVLKKKKLFALKQVQNFPQIIKSRNFWGPIMQWCKKH